MIWEGEDQLSNNSIGILFDKLRSKIIKKVNKERIVKKRKEN